MSLNYPYSDGDLLSTPQTYRYTSFQGEEFIKAWQASRQAVLAQLPEPALLQLCAPIDAAPTDVTALLTQICLGLRVAPLDEGGLAQYWLPRLLKKFEVSKHLHAAYEPDPPHRALPDSDFLALMPYLLLAECMIHGWRNTGAGYYLNALLKLNDSLISQQSRLDAVQGAYLAWILDTERQLIAQVNQ